jgi:hypothetical protein
MPHIDRKGRPNNIVVVNVVRSDPEQAHPNDHKPDMPDCTHSTSAKDAERNTEEENKQGRDYANCDRQRNMLRFGAHRNERQCTEEKQLSRMKGQASLQLIAYQSIVYQRAFRHGANRTVGERWKSKSEGVFSVSL